MSLRVIENFRAFFYAPFYLAHATGAYERAGAQIVLHSSPSPDESARALNENQADVMWGGPLRVLMQHEEDPACDVRCFQGVVCRDPFFLVGRTANPGFSWAALAGQRLATVAEVPTPWICLAQDLRLAGIDPASLDRRADLPMAESAAALQRGELDVVQLFEPYVEALVDAGCHVWHASATRGPTAYTALITRTPTIATHRAELAAMTRGMAATLDWMRHTADADIAAALEPYFPTTPLPRAAAAIARYRKLELWDTAPGLLRPGFDWLQDAMKASGVLRRGSRYSDCVETEV